MTAGEFGKALRRWRDRVPPESAGLPAGGQRRAVGLRREELAMLAGNSVDYVTRLAQGRASHPSAQVVECLGRALRLSGPELAHLFGLAGLVPPGPGTVPSQITPSVQRVLDRLTTTPLAVYDASWTLLLANKPHKALMGDSSGWRGNQRNAVWRKLLGPPGRVRHDAGVQRVFEAALVADLRAAAARYPADPAIRRLVADLRRDSERFVERWDSGAVGRHESARVIVDHPDVGPLTLDIDVLTVAGGDLRIRVYSAEPGTEDASRLALLTVLGTQRLNG